MDVVWGFFRGDYVAAVHSKCCNRPDSSCAPMCAFIPNKRAGCLLGLVHVRIALAFFVIGRTGAAMIVASTIFPPRRLCRVRCRCHPRRRRSVASGSSDLFVEG
ncbi:hypothetical protein [Xanthomonas oryzae pv. oryzae MAFF 311018]|nr:hypothetical protein [Xanthomonas oryzae pv. oryzae MAFF 311018]